LLDTSATNEHLDLLSRDVSALFGSPGLEGNVLSL
jgi:hypothetical protein